jgi:hypothetical protein
MARVQTAPEAPPKRHPKTDEGEPKDARERASNVQAEPTPPFFERLAALSELDWQVHKLYIYRRWPRISRSDQAHYIDQVRHPIDEAWLLEHHGSGNYSLRLNDKKRTLDSYAIEVHDLNRPPKLKPEELIECEENARYFELWPQPQPAPETEQAAESGAAAAAVHEMGRLARQAQARPAVDDTLADLYLQTAKARDALVERLTATEKPAADVVDQITTLDKILAFVERVQKPAQPAAAAQPAVADQLALAREVIGLLKEMKPEPGAEARGNPSVLGPVRELIEVARLFKETFAPLLAPAAAGGEAPAPPLGFPEVELEKSPWERIFTAAAPALGMHLPRLVETLVERLLGAFAPKGPAPGFAGIPAGLPGLGAAATAPALNAPGPPPPAAPLPAQPPADASPVDPAEMQRQQLSMLISSYAPKILAGAASEDPRDAGERLAEFALEGIGEGYYALAAIPKQEWMALLQAHPLWAQLILVPQGVEAFVDGFLNWAVAPSGGQDGSEVEPEQPVTGAESPRRKTASRERSKAA